MTTASREFAEFAAALADQYTIERELGRGGMGVVYLARDLRLDRLVAIKTLPEHLASDARVRERFLREARTAAALSHPGIAPIHRADELHGHVFFVMRFVDGASLAQHVAERGPLPPREVAGYVRDVAAALDAAHAQGVVHRDVKAENILVEQASGRAVVTDFGIARSAAAGPTTATGLVLGTVYYMSPEQVAGEPLDGRSDLYSLGVTAFHALSGRFPFEHESASAVLVAHVTRRAPSLRDVAPDVPPALAAIVDRCLAREPDDRFASAAALREALDEVLASLSDAPAASVAPAAPPVRLSESEARRVWARAAELHAPTGASAPPPLPTPDRAADAPRPSASYPLDVVRESAREAGLATAHVDRALAERGHGVATDVGPLVRDVSPRRATRSLLGPRALEYEVVLQGELPEREYERVVEHVRRELADVGAVSVVGRTLTWASAERGRRVRVTVQPRDGRTTLRVAESLAPLSHDVVGGGIATGVTAAIPTVSMVGAATELDAVALASVPVLFAAVAGATRAVYGWLAGRRGAGLHALAARLGDEIHALLPGVAPAASVRPLPGPTTSTPQPSRPPRRHRTPA